MRTCGKVNMLDLKGKKIILASNSPRRHELLAALDVEFEVDTRNNFNEYISPEIPHSQISALMSQGKSQGFHRPLEENEILITADTIVLCDGLVLGKPHSREEAVKMLKMLSGNMHEVITAVTIRDTHSQKTISDNTKVFFKNLTDSEIDYYIDNYKPFDKAGAYGVQEWIGYMAIERIEGSVFTVMGLPVHLVYQELMRMCG